jgi:hypothetical protein
MSKMAPACDDEQRSFAKRIEAESGGEGRFSHYHTSGLVPHFGRGRTWHRHKSLHDNTGTVDLVWSKLIVDMLRREYNNT